MPPAAGVELAILAQRFEGVVLASPQEEKVYAAARAKGMFTMREDAIIKALAGSIPFEEVNTLGGEMLVDEEAPEELEDTPIPVA